MLALNRVKYLLGPAAWPSPTSIYNPPEISEEIDTPTAPNQYKLIQSEPFLLRENQDLLPQAYVLFNLQTYGTIEAIYQQLTSEIHDPKLTALAETKQQVDALENLANRDLIEVTYRPAGYSRPQAEQIIIETAINEDAFLVISHNYLSGWRAKIDGVSTPVYPTNGNLMGLLLQKRQTPVANITGQSGKTGKTGQTHKIILNYAPASLA
ncbi:MAG TPA: hypothetical protein ENN77_01060, partial [Candidatus Wirthbacteria bacterium]|nr:hypothetical protein [Candidatus Wirthbacteria bacterium]